MQVIKKGRKQMGWAKEFTCTGSGNGGGGCGATLLVEKTDVYQTSRGYYDGSTDYFITFCCAECGVETDIKAPFSPHDLPNKQAWHRAHGKETF